MCARRLVSAALAALLLAAAASAQPSPLSLVPARSPIVVQVRGWERIIGRFKELVKAAAPDYAELVAGKVDEGISEALMGRELKGLAKDGPMFIVFTEVPKENMEVPELALILRVTNYIQFRDGFLKDDERKELKAKDGYEATKIENRDVYFLNKGDFAVLALTEKARKLFQEKNLDSLAGKLNKSLEAKLLESDVSVYVDAKAITRQFGDEISSAKALIEQAILQGEDAGTMSKEQIELFKGMINGVFQFVADCERGVLALNFEPNGLSIKAHTEFGDKTKTNAVLKLAKPASGAELGKLPGPGLVFAAGNVGQEFVKMSNPLAMSGGQFGGNAKEDKAVTEARKELESLKLEDWAFTADLPSEGVQVFRYSAPAKAVAAHLKLYRAIPENSGFSGLALKGKPEVKADAEKLHGFTFHSVSYAIDIDKTLENQPEPVRDMVKGMFEKMIGGPLRLWIGADGKSVVQVTAKDWTAASKKLEAYFSGKDTLAASTGFTATRKQLPDQASLIVMIDGARYAYVIIDMMGEYLGQFLGVPGLDKVKKPAGPASYIGLAVALQPGHGTLDLWVPADGVKAILKVLQPILEGIKD